MVSFSSILWALFFFGIGGWFFYHRIIKHIPNYIKIKRLFLRTVNPNIKEINFEIKVYVDLIKNDKTNLGNPVLYKLLFIKILTKDISLLIILSKNQKNNDKQNILLRALVAQLYEFYKDIGSIYDAKFEKKFVQILSPDLLKNLKTLKKMTAMIGQLEFEKIKEIRMNVISHRDFDSVKQYDIINKISSLEIIQIANSALFLLYFYNAFHTALLVRVLKKSNNPIPNIKLFKNHISDFEIWETLAKTMVKK